jgi:hypothetical protein
MVIGEFGALLVRVTLPLAVPVDVGANATVNVELLPELIVSGTASPLILKALGETVTCVIVRFAVPELLRVIVCDALVPVVTLPKLTLEGVEESCP